MSACRAFCFLISRSEMPRVDRWIVRRRPSRYLALKVIETALAPRTVKSPLAWSACPDWKLDYCNIARLSAEEIRQRRVEFDRQKNVAKTVRAEAGVPSSDARSRL
jgi:hypothetical protein